MQSKCNQDNEMEQKIDRITFTLDSLSLFILFFYMFLLFFSLDCLKYF